MSDSADVRGLSWGRRYVMVRPDHFRIDYAINPYMDTADQPDPQRAMAQWVDLVSTVERLGGTVEVVPQRADAPDMVYAMNLGLGVVRPEGAHVVMSHMRHAERRMEGLSAQPWFEGSGRTLAGWTKDLFGLPVIGIGSVGVRQAYRGDDEAEAPSLSLAPLVRLLEEGELDLVALGRALLSEPQWPTKVREGRLDEIRPYSKADEARYH